MAGLILAHGTPCGILSFSLVHRFPSLSVIPPAFCIYVGCSEMILTGAAVLANYKV